MTKVLLVIVLAAFALHAYRRVQEPEPVVDREQLRDQVRDLQVERQDSRRAVSDRTKFRCDGRTRCPQMTSCEEATFFLENCPGVEMDGEGDGVPCERQWCGHR